MWETRFGDDFVDQSMKLIKKQDFQLFMAIIHFAHSYPVAWPTNSWLLDRTGGYTEKSISRSLISLGKDGWIDRVLCHRDLKFRRILILRRPSYGYVVESDQDLCRIMHAIRCERLNIPGCSPLLYLSSERPFPTIENPDIKSGIPFGVSRFPEPAKQTKSKSQADSFDTQADNNGHPSRQNGDPKQTQVSAGLMSPSHKSEGRTNSRETGGPSTTPEAASSSASTGGQAPGDRPGRRDNPAWVAARATVAEIFRVDTGAYTRMMPREKSQEILAQIADWMLNAPNYPKLWGKPEDVLTECLRMCGWPAWVDRLAEYARGERKVGVSRDR